MRPPSFLRALVRAPQETFLLRNTRTGALVVSVLEAAFDSETRKKGLLGRTSLPADRALVIAPCGGVHTFFMKFAIDCVFVARDGTVRRIFHAVRPGRLAISPFSYCVIEMASGVASAARLQVGDRLVLEPAAVSERAAVVQ